MKLLLFIFGSLSLAGASASIFIKTNSEKNIVAEVEKQKLKKAKWNNDFILEIEKVVAKSKNDEQVLKEVILNAIYYDASSLLKVDLQKLEEAEIIRKEFQQKNI